MFEFTLKASLPVLINEKLFWLLLCSLCFPLIGLGADIEVTLPTSDSSSGFVVKNSGGSTVFKVAGDGSLTLATSIGASYLSTEARHTKTIGSTAKTSDYTITTNDGVILANPSGGAFTLTLPTASGSAGRTYSVVMSGGGQPVTLDGKNSETIDGALTTSLSSTGTALTVISDGSNWYSLSMATTGTSSASNSIYGKTAIVAASGGDYTSPNDAVTNLSSWCGTPSSSNPCLISIGPGYYTLTASLDLSSYEYLSVAGTGEQATFLTIADNHVIQAANESEIRNLTLIGSGSTNNKYGIYSSGKAIRVNNVTVKITSTEANTHGIYLENSTAALTANNVHITVNSSTAKGISLSSVGGSITLNNVHIRTKGSSGHGFNASSLAGPLLIKNSTIATTGSSASSLSFSNHASGSATIRDSIITAQNRGIFLSTSAASQIYLDNVDMETGGSSNPLFHGFFASVATTVHIQNSQLYAPYGTGLKIDDADFTFRLANVMIASTVAVTNSPTLNCFNIYDNSFTALTGTGICTTNNN